MPRLRRAAVPHPTVACWLLLGVFLLVGCGPTDTPAELAPTPTMPVAQFTPVAGQLNEEKALEAQSQIEDQATEDFNAEDIKTGSRVYANRCAECHGAELEGTDQAGALTVLDMTQDDFLIFLRTGGDLGNSHQFGPAKASNAGIEDLYAFLITTLGAE